MLSESIYIRFRAILAISIVVSILTPFVLYYLKGISTWMYYWESLQTLVVLLLVLAFMQLYDLIIKYKLPKKYLKYYSKKEILEWCGLFGRDCTLCCKANDSELYLQCTTEVGNIMLDELQMEESNLL